MTQSGYANAIVDTMLGWLKGLASWVLKLFNLSGGFSPLKFLADNWLKLLIILLITGMAVDLLVWLIRWRPHWVWFHKKRVIINDKNFFAQEKFADVEGQQSRSRPNSKSSVVRPRRNWEDNEFVVPGAARRRREEMARREAQLREAREQRLKSLRAGEPTDVFQDELFDVNAEQKSSDTYEDEVFSVSNLPKPDKETQAQQIRKGKPQPQRRKGSYRKQGGGSRTQPSSAKKGTRQTHSSASHSTMVRSKKRPAPGQRLKPEQKKR